MPLAPLTVAAYPNVPNLPGVPALARLATTVIPFPVLAVADTLGIGIVSAPQWGIFDSSGNAVVVADSVIAVDYQGDARVPTYPLEQGAFTSYNKVQMPFAARVTLVCGGSAARRTAFLASLDAAKLSLTPYVLMEPEHTHPNITVTHYEYDRTSEKGVSLITADVDIEEVRLTATSATATTASASGANPEYGGTVKTIPVTATQIPNLTPN